MLEGFSGRSQRPVGTYHDLSLPARSARDHRIGVGSLQLLLEYAAERGIDQRKLLEAARVRASVLDDHDATIEPEAELSAVAVLAQELGAPFANGFALGLRYRLTSLGVLGLGLMSRENAREAMEWGLRYAGTAFSFIRYHQEQGPSGPVLRMTLDHLPADLCAFLVARDLGVMHVVHRELLPDLPFTIKGIQLSLPRLAGMEHAEALLGCSIETDHPDCRLHLDPEILDTALGQANRITALQCEAHCERLLQERALSSDVVSQVRRRLLESGMPLPPVDEIASALNMSERSLRRQLAREGFHWRGLIEERLATTAREMLRTGRHTVQETATALGYAETASFSRAFKRWTGVSPKAFAETRNQTDNPADQGAPFRRKTSRETPRRRLPRK